MNMPKMTDLLDSMTLGEVVKAIDVAQTMPIATIQSIAESHRHDRRARAEALYLTAELMARSKVRGECQCASEMLFSQGRCLLHAGMMKVLYEAWGLPGVYELSDGYGPTGHVPVQGYDWSGVRDSSTPAVEAMYAVAKREFVPVREEMR